MHGYKAHSRGLPDVHHYIDPAVAVRGCHQHGLLPVPFSLGGRGVRDGDTGLQIWYLQDPRAQVPGAGRILMGKFLVVD